MNDLRILRGNRKQSEVAKKIGITTSYYGMIEIGIRNPSLKIAMKLAKYFEVPVELLFDDDKRKDTIGNFNMEQENHE